jgi:hypothetical protein
VPLPSFRRDQLAVILIIAAIMAAVILARLVAF